jgi:phosphoglycolate phosphatase-like HAD superfamily hydrolase
LTNKLRGATIKILQGLDLAQYFTQIGGVDGPYPPKPAPDGLLSIIEQAGTVPSQTLLVGDSPIDMHTARNAGARICVARYGFGYVATPPAEFKGDEFFINHPLELVPIVRAKLN